MASSKIQYKKQIKTKNFKFNNLAQYSPTTYYLAINDVKTAAGIPSNALIINASLAGWAGLGTGPNVELANDDKIWIFYPNESSITSSSYAEVRFVYVE